MSVKKIIYDTDCRNAILRGVERLADAVAITMGPNGRTVCIEKIGLDTPTVTNDGVTVAKEINLPNRWEDMGVRLCKEVASRTNEFSGDGTTTATVLCRALLKEALKQLEAGYEVLGILEGLNLATGLVQASLEEWAKPVRTHSDVMRVATLSSHDPVIGKLIADAMDEVGRDGVITVEEGRRTETYIESSEGAEVDSGYARAEFANTEEGECVLSEPVCVFYDGCMDSPQAVATVLNAALQGGERRPVVFFADDFNGDVLVTLTQNMKLGTIDSCAIKMPLHGEKRTALMEDLAVLTGGEVCSLRKGDNPLKWELERCGSAAKIKVTKRKTVIIRGDGTQEDILARIDKLKYEQSMSPSEYDRSKLGERISRLTGGMTMIRVGASTETEMRQTKRSIEDALSSTKSAIEAGVLPGGGAAYLHIADSILKEELQDPDLDESVKAGYRVAVAALEAPFRTILHNSGYDPGPYVEKLREPTELGVWAGFDVQRGEVANLDEKGICDPTKVLRVAWENAVSFATTVIKVDVAISPVQFEEDIQPREIG